MKRMKKTVRPGGLTFFFLLMLLVLLLSNQNLAQAAKEYQLEEIIREIEQKYTGESAEGEMNMQVVTRHYSRQMSMKYWSKGEDRFLIRLENPAKDKGISTLKIAKEMWNYLPKVDKVVKIPSSMMGGSWMGSHITNDDLVKETQIDEDYTFRLIEDKITQLTIESIPKPEAVVVWGKIIYTIAMPDLVPLEITYFDEENKKVRVIKYSRIEEIDGHKIPLKMEILPLETPGESTVIEYQSIHFGVKLDDDFFSLKTLKR